MPSKDRGKLNSLVETLRGGALARAAQQAHGKHIIELLVYRTPVDSGRARAHWSVTLAGEVPAIGEQVDRTGAGTVALNQAALDGLQRAGTVRFVNPLPYIKRLEYGHSQQAPQGWIRQTASEASINGAEFYQRALLGK